ncbi:MAG: chemotaxis protein CheW [Herminiimonas sp.]|nr:chemotaxis protein CheW [Herminiimonas sp.]
MPVALHAVFGTPDVVDTSNTAGSASNLAAAAIREAASATELFGSFFLGDDEFALLADSVRKVVNYPEKVIGIPLLPAFLEGVFTLRGNVIPVLNLGRIFNPQASAAGRSDKIAIIDHQQIQIGIAFHSTGEILRVRQQQRSHLAYRDMAPHGVICGTIRLDDGARLLQILDPAALISIENVPQVQAMKSTSRQVETNHFHLQAERRQCVSCKVGGTAFAFEMHAIREIINVPKLKSSVLTSKLCIGRINLRGHADLYQ